MQQFDTFPNTFAMDSDGSEILLPLYSIKEVVGKDDVPFNSFYQITK